MGYYRRLPLDVRIAIWVDEHPKFMREIGIAAVATSAAAMLLFVGWFLVGPAAAQNTGVCFIGETATTMPTGAEAAGCLARGGNYVAPGSGVTIQSGSISSGSISFVTAKCAAGRVRVVVESGMTQPCATQSACPFLTYKCALPSDLTDEE